MTFGENLKALRTSRTLSQKDLAAELGFSYQNISKWERNESLPDIETLLSIARFFGTTTDSLLGYAKEETFSTLKIDKKELMVYSAYPEGEELLTKTLILAVDREGKLAGMVFIPRQRRFRGGYVRGAYELLDEENSTLLHEYAYCTRQRETLVGHYKLRIPDQGFLVAVPNATFAAKRIMEFVTPEEYAAYLDPDSHEEYYSNRNGKSLFADILKQGELDHISLTLLEDGLLLQKPAQTVDPMSVNIETLARIVRKELQREHNKQLEEMKQKIEEIEELAENAECIAEDLDSRVSELEQTVAALKALLGQNENADEETEEM